MRNPTLTEFLRAPEPGTDAYDALGGMPALEYKLALTPDQVRDIRAELADPDNTLVVIGERYQVPTQVIGSLKRGHTYGWVGDAGDGSGDRPPRMAFQLSDAAIDYIRERGGDLSGAELARSLVVSEAAVSRVLGGSRSGGWRTQNKDTSVLALSPNICSVMLQSIRLGLKPTEVAASLSQSRSEDVAPRLLVSELNRLPASAHRQRCDLVSGYTAYRDERAACHDRVAADLARALTESGLPVGRELPRRSEELMIRALGDDLSVRSVCLAAGLEPTRLYGVMSRWKRGLPAGALSRVAAAAHRRQSERERWALGVSRKLIAALRRDRPSLQNPPVAWPALCSGIFADANPERFDVAYAN